MSLTIRPIQEADLASIVKLLNPFILETAVTFDTDVYSIEQRKPWLNQFSNNTRHQCLVAEYEGNIVGYANSGPLKPKKAYDTSVEVSIYCSPTSTNRGVGSNLYAELFKLLSDEDVHRAHALITLPNAASIALHKKFGFYEVGTLNEAGHKFGQYHHVYWMEKKL